MSESEHEMEHDGSDSDSEFEVIALNPNVLYESDESSTDDESFLPEEIKQPEPVVVEEREEPKKIVEEDTEMTVVKVKDEEVSCDTSMDLVNDEETCVSSIDKIKKVRKKLKLEEYKQRRANQKPEPTKPLFDLPKRIANYELCDAPASLPLLILPTDPNCLVMMSNNQIVKKEEPGSDHAIPAFNPVLYEEKIIVSMGCNTDLSIPPQEDDSNFLVDIVNNLNKNNNNVDSILNSSTTLFSSIQAVVQGKCTTSDAADEPMCEKDKEHGEDKTIMHLRKDRLRPFKCTISTQTDSQPFFPPLVLTPAPKFNRSRNARNFRRKVSRSRSRSRSFSPSMDYEHRVKCNGRYSRSQHSTHSSSMTGSSSSSGSESSGSESDDSSCSASSDSLKRFNDRQNFRFYNRNQRDQGFKYPEERKVVYIGDLEEETTKEDIRKKFLNYGTILKISLHQKEDGLRYGFVTFAEVSCAYEVIDKFSKDPLISKYDIRFGGRRKFCKQTYADLDFLAEEKFEETQKAAAKDLSFEDLLKLAKKQISTKK